MAESTLNANYHDLRREVGSYYGFGRVPSDFQPAAAEIVESVIKSGLRQLYFPPPLMDRPPHQWTFLRPTTTLTTTAPYTAGTVAIASAVVTLSDGTWPDWAAEGALKVGGTTYSVASRGGGSQITLDDENITVTGTNTYSLSRPSYDLPDSFGTMVGTMTYSPGISATQSIERIGENQMRALRQQSTLIENKPAKVAIVPITKTSTASTRFRAQFYPSPDAAYVLTYKFTVLPDKLSVDDLYAYGGAAHSETLLESCLAIAESRMEDAPGIPHGRFLERLSASISYDQTLSAESLGLMGDNSDGSEWPMNRADNRVTYKGVLY